jgi:putative aminopeptidase FrvX
MTEVPELLDQLLRARGPSGRETPVARIWKEAASFAEVSGDGIGSTIARFGTGSPLIGMFGHIDEIGLIVTDIDEHGFLWFAEVGGWDPHILTGQRVIVDGPSGEVPGVIGRKPAHLLIGTEDAKKAQELSELCIDIGCSSEGEAAELIQIGDVAVMVGEPLRLAGDRLVSKSMDNRVGAYVVLEALRRCSTGSGPIGSVAAVASTQEETGLSGARTAAYALQPDVAIAVDVFFETNAPGVRRREFGRHPFGSGPIIGRAPNLSPLVPQLLIETAEELEIPYSVCGYGSDLMVPAAITNTDADAIHSTGRGIATAVLSVPTRYLHSSVEMIDLHDVEATVELLTAFVSRVDSEQLGMERL